MRRFRVDGPRAAVLLLASLLAALSLTVPGSRAAFTAAVTNATDTLASLPFFTCSAAILASSPRIYYKLDESGTATTAVDSSGQGRDGTYRGTTTKGAGRACVRDTGTAVTFDGSSGYVSFGSSLQVPTTYSAELWFRTTSNRGGLLSGFGASPTGLSATVDRVVYLTDAGNVVFGVNSVLKNTITSPGTYRDGSWHHVLATVGPGGMRLYVDGAQVATSATTATATYGGFFRVAFDNLLLWPSAPTSYFLAGTLDEVAVYTTTLTATDALNHYRAGV